MSANNGVIRIGRKGIKKFAFGEEGAPDERVFSVDVVVAFQQWIIVDDSFRGEEKEDGRRPISVKDIPAYNQAAVEFVADLGGGEVTTAEALDFLARLREEYDALAHFFQPKLLGEQDSQDTLEPVSELRFSVEGES